MKQTNVNKLLKRSIFLIFTIISVTACRPKKLEYQILKGSAFGTTFNIQYSKTDNNNYNAELSLLFNNMNNSLSTYHPYSLISQLNKGVLKLEVDKNFINVFNISKKVFKETNGYFDPTIGKMVNEWGFGPQKTNYTISKKKIDSLMQFVGFDKVVLKGNTIVKQNENIVFDFNATAKGYGVDLVAEFLNEKNIENYLIEIGGEIRTKGVNSRGLDWTIGIDEPNFDGSRSQQIFLSLKNESIATSGNYRKFKIDPETGKKIAHTFDPKTGSPAKTDLLSASVIAPLTCAEVDAYATAFMAMGFEKAKVLADKHTEMKVCFIYLQNNKLETFKSSDLNFLDLE